MTNDQHIVVWDECVSARDRQAFKVCLNMDAEELEEIDLASTLSGITDQHLIKHVLTEKTLFCTRDRVMHNNLLQRGLVSRCLLDGQIESGPVKGVAKRKETPEPRGDLQGGYHPSKPAIRGLFMPQTAKPLKRLNTKRRRIRSHFGGLNCVCYIALTVSMTSYRGRLLTGLRMKAAGISGVKGITASENYILDKVEKPQRPLAAVCEAMTLSLVLLLHEVRTELFYDAACIPAAPDELAARCPSEWRHLYQALKACFPSIAFKPCSKGRFIESLRAKLHQLTSCQSNEMVPGRLDTALAHFSRQPDMFP